MPGKAGPSRPAVGPGSAGRGGARAIPTTRSGADSAAQRIRSEDSPRSGLGAACWAGWARLREFRFRALDRTAARPRSWPTAMPSRRRSRASRPGRAWTDHGPIMLRLAQWMPAIAWRPFAAGSPAWCSATCSMQSLWGPDSDAGLWTHRGPPVCRWSRAAAGRGASAESVLDVRQRALEGRCSHAPHAWCTTASVRWAVRDTAPCALHAKQFVLAKLIQSWLQTTAYYQLEHNCLQCYLPSSRLKPRRTNFNKTGTYSGGYGFGFVPVSSAYVTQSEIIQKWLSRST